VRRIEDAKLRSRNMASVRGKGTQPELAVRKELFRRGYRFRINVRALPGTPDVVLPRRRCAIFVHGCFWHSHKCPRGARPLTNRRFWNKKLDNNVRRDRLNRVALRRAGWKVFIIWECQLRKEGLDRALEAFPPIRNKRPRSVFRSDK